jgi:ribosomal protein S14
MQKLYIKDRKRRHMRTLLEKKELVIKYLIVNSKIPLDIKKKAFLKLCHISRYATITKICNRCVLTNRDRAIYKKFKLSRIFLKKYALPGQIMGVKKAS